MTMRAFRVEALGAAPLLTDVPVPDPGPGEVRIRVAATGLNFADLLMLQGSYQDTPPVPFTLGMEVVGTVEALGKDVAGLAPGDRVSAVPGHGGLAERVCVAAARCVPLATSVTDIQGAAFPVAYGTAHLALGHRTRLQPGETLLVLGAAGGVGLAAVEIGRRMGARVIASARGAARLAVATEAGAHAVIDSDAPDLRGALRAQGGLDVVFDPVGGPAYLDALRATRPEGRLVTIGFAGGEVPQIPANLLLVKNLTAIGVAWGGYFAFRPDVVRQSLGELAAWIADGALVPQVGHVLPLERAAEGLDLLRARRATGKIVVTQPS